MLEQIRALNGTPSRMTSAPGWGATLDQRIAMMDRAGVDVQVLSVSSYQPYGPDRSAAMAAARDFNAIYKKVVDSCGGRFAAFGCVPLPHVEDAIVEARRCLDELGFAGITLGCSVLRRPHDDPEFEPFWAELDQRQAVVFFHPTGIGAPMTDAFDLDWLVGAPFEDTVTALRLVLSGLTRRHPGVKFIVPHLGGTIPYVWSRLGAPGLHEKLRELYYDTVNLAPGMLRAACGMLPASHVMLGTDFPYVLPDNYEAFVRSCEDSGLPTDAITGILDGNAQAILNLPSR
jgi:predicted TIM-barrel fold metal-dependent hydrolase